MIDEPCSPSAITEHDERRERFRVAAQRLIDDHAARRRVDPEALEWARGIVKRFKPLGRPLSDGTPTA